MNKTPTKRRMCDKCRSDARKWYKERQDRGLCGLCGRERNDEGKLCYFCRNKSKLHQRKMRTDIIKHYGEKCNVCGITDIRILDIDHINGKKDRDMCGSSNVIYNRIKKNNYPSSYQILCRNCNWIKYLRSRNLTL